MELIFNLLFLLVFIFIEKSSRVLTKKLYLNIIRHRRGEI